MLGWLCSCALEVKAGGHLSHGIEAGSIVQYWLRRSASRPHVYHYHTINDKDRDLSCGG